jgi:acyl-CoA dehydrogenase|tara:strand:+ start:225 stop:413 length:189 start_codon:yes stop_codon:yes gene_type:complete
LRGALWTFPNGRRNWFLPNAAASEDLSNRDDACIVFELGKNPIVSEFLNCDTPNTASMEWRK